MKLRCADTANSDIALSALLCTFFCGKSSGLALELVQTLRVPHMAVHDVCMAETHILSVTITDGTDPSLDN